MDVKQTITDAGYITVGVGVLAGQRVRERGAALGERARDTRAQVHAGVADQLEDLRTTVSEGTAKVTSRADIVRGQATSLTGDLGERIRTRTDAAQSSVASVNTALVDVGTKLREQAREQATRTRSSVLDQANDLLDRATPLVDEVRQRVEPLAAQLQVVPAQLDKVIEIGRDRISSISGTPTDEAQGNAA